MDSICLEFQSLADVFMYAAQPYSLISLANLKNECCCNLPFTWSVTPGFDLNTRPHELCIERNEVEVIVIEDSDSPSHSACSSSSSNPRPGSQSCA